MLRRLTIKDDPFGCNSSAAHSPHGPPCLNFEVPEKAQRTRGRKTGYGDYKPQLINYGVPAPALAAVSEFPGGGGGSCVVGSSPASKIHKKVRRRAELDPYPRDGGVDPVELLPEALFEKVILDFMIVRCPWS